MTKTPTHGRSSARKYIGHLEGVGLQKFAHVTPTFENGKDLVIRNTGTGAENVSRVFLKTRIFRDPRLPRPFPGCWQHKEWQKQYTKAYVRLMRQTEYAEVERVMARS